jgi:hypothetical protein
MDVHRELVALSGAVQTMTSAFIAVVARRVSDEAIQFSLYGFWIASWSLSSGAHSRDPVARNDGRKHSG